MASPATVDVRPYTDADLEAVAAVFTASVHVAPSYARRGVASALYGHVERLLVSAGAGELLTEASLVARAVFERFGFVVTEEQEVSLRGSSFRRFAMRKQLVPAQPGVSARLPRPG